MNPVCLLQRADGVSEAHKVTTLRLFRRKIVPRHCAVDLYRDLVATERRTPGSQTSLREANRARIIDAVKLHGGITQVELAGATGLSPATVSNIVKELTTAGTLNVSFSTRSGRRAVQVTLARSHGLVVGVHFSSRHLRVALSDLNHTIISEHRMPLAPGHHADAGLDRTALLISDMLESVNARYDEVRAVGIAVPAPIDTRTGQVSALGLLRGWEGVPVASVFEERIKCPVYADNEANVGALAEWRLGAARGTENIAYLRASHGVGGGLILGGQLFRGKDGQAGEIGHMSSDEHGPICRCGNRGCLEAFVGSPALLEQLPTSHRHFKLTDVVHEANAGDPICRRVVADAGRQIGTTLASVYNLLNLDMIVIGGELAEADELLLSPIRHTFERSVLGSRSSVPEIAQAVLGMRAELFGAIGLALDHVGIAEPDLITVNG